LNKIANIAINIMKNIFLSFVILCTCSQVNAQSWQDLKDVPLVLSYPVVVSLNGNIHVMGGGASGGATSIHLRYKPSTNKWDTLAPVPYKAQQPAGAVVKGKIHFCGGGFPNTGTRLDKHYVYDPDSNKWSAAANLPVATAIHKAVSLDDKLYVLSGQPDKQLCEIYDPATNMWTQKASLPDVYFWYGAIVSDNKSIYRFGGGGFTGPQQAAHSYNKANDSWTPLPFMPLALHGHDATLVNDSLVFICGGFNLDDKPYTWIYNINSKKYSVYKSLPISRTYHNIVSIDNCIYSVGGNNDLFPSVNISLIKLCPGNSPLAVERVEAAKPYSIAQSPGELSIALNNASQFSISVMDLSGKIVYSETSGTGRIRLSKERFNSSLYIVLVHYNGMTYNEKLMLTE
jgi:N-acetylneuraminic acid mutarotase